MKASRVHEFIPADIKAIRSQFDKIVLSELVDFFGWASSTIMLFYRRWIVRSKIVNTSPTQEYKVQAIEKIWAGE